jgi:hypothetical protein
MASPERVEIGSRVGRFDERTRRIRAYGIAADYYYLIAAIWL